VTTALAHPLDLCTCGDFRRDHPAGGKCRLCGGTLGPCPRFLFSRSAPPEEIAAQARNDALLDEAIRRADEEDAENERANALVREGW
jgi:hypothetical protein